MKLNTIFNCLKDILSTECISVWRSKDSLVILASDEDAYNCIENSGKKILHMDLNIEIHFRSSNCHDSFAQMFVVAKLQSQL